MQQNMSLNTPESPFDCGAGAVVPEIALVLSRVLSPRGVSMIVGQHKIHETPQGWALGSVDVLDPKGVMDIVRRLDSEAASRSGPQYMPANILAMADDVLIWHVPAAVRPMFFLAGRHKPIKLDVIWPSLIFHAGSGSLTLYATAATRRPDPVTPLYHAPLMNHRHGSGLCFGSVPRPQRADLSSMAGFESAVFQTYFSHVWGEWPMAKCHGDNYRTKAMLEFYERLAERGSRRFPKSALLASDMTLGDVIEQAA